METRSTPLLTAKNMTQIAAFSALIALCSQIIIPTTIPFTLQLFGIFLALELLGGKKGTLSILLYLLLGAVGLPVFHGFRGGIAVFFDITGGFLVGFLFIGLIHWGTTRIFPPKKHFTYLSFFIGLVVCYTLSLLWFFILFFSTPFSLSALKEALFVCVLPFLLPDLLKLVLAISIGRQIKRIAPDLF